LLTKRNVPLSATHTGCIIIPRTEQLNICS